jgi:hypothetical protein
MTRRLLIEPPVGVEVNKSSQQYALFPTNALNCWESLQSNQRFLAEVVPGLGAAEVGACAENHNSDAATDKYAHLHERWWSSISHEPGCCHHGAPAHLTWLCTVHSLLMCEDLPDARV